jgi:hypothetical protein
LETVKNLMPSQKMMYIKQKTQEEEEAVRRVTEKTRSQRLNNNAAVVIN